MKDAIDADGAAGHLFIAAASNSYWDNDADGSYFDEPMMGGSTNYPSSYTCANIIAVAATGRFDDLRPWSNYGMFSVDLGAPGSLILSTLPGNQYDYWSGTSMATPQWARSS